MDLTGVIDVSRYILKSPGFQNNLRNTEEERRTKITYFSIFFCLVFMFVRDFSPYEKNLNMRLLFFL